MRWLTWSKGRAAFGASRLSAGLELLGLWNTKVAANFNRQVIVDFIMPWNSAPSVCAQVTPPRVAASFTEQRATMCGEVRQ